MKYLSGAVYAPILHWQYGGVMLTPEMGNNPNLDGVTWAADNGCYTAGNKFSADKWLKFLLKFQNRGNCLFAVAPDVPFNAIATWERSREYLPMIRQMGYSAALAIQNGIENTIIEWDSFDAVFIAGTKQFKTSHNAYQVIQEAKKRNKFVHIARRNSHKAIQEAWDMGADSCDGTYLAFGPDTNWPKVQSWFENLCLHDIVNMWDSRYGYCVKCRRQIRRKPWDNAVI